MNWFAPPRGFDPAHPEFLDCPRTDAAAVREEMRLLEEANRRFDGTRLVLSYVRRIVAPPRPAKLRVLDLGTGAADIPRALVKWARGEGIEISVTAVDVNDVVVGFAREACREWPEIEVVQHDLRALPFADGGFDLVLCSLALHHFSDAEAVGILSRMQTLATRGFVVSDLRRNRLATLLTSTLANVLVRNPTFRADAMHSSRAAFTVSELDSLARRAGVKNFRIKRHHGVFRMVLEGRK